jgi:biofilm PGA synthesis N-glycosyltransferase PgaC
MTDFFLAFSESPAYWLCMTFLAGFPVVVAALVVNGSRSLLLDRQSEATERYFPHREDLDRARERWPLVTVIVPARDEERTIVDTVSTILEIDWPQLEVIVVDDGSKDSTAQQLATLSRNPSVQVLSHPEPLGKSESLNEGFALATSEIVLIMDADAAPAANVLNRMVPYFIKHRDIVAVTGNPRVVNASGLWGKLQAIEFTSTISALRRGQSAWGRINTISGVFRPPHRGHRAHLASAPRWLSLRV